MSGNVIQLREKARTRAPKEPKVPFGVATVLVLCQDQQRSLEIVKLLRESRNTQGYHFLTASNYFEARKVLSGPHTIYALLCDTVHYPGNPENAGHFIGLEKIQRHIRFVDWMLDEDLWVPGHDANYRKEMVDRFIARRVDDTAVWASRDVRSIRSIQKISKDDVMGLVGNSAAMQGYLHKLQAVAIMDAPVLIEGETGSGKSEGARWIHRYREKKLKTKGPLVEINMSAIPVTLAESTLFGHRKGAFTGATESQMGQFEVANGGTIFLDEIGDCPLSLQKKLLKVIEEKTFTRVGTQTPIRFKAKIICATNRNLREMVKAGIFREDLFHRISTLYVPCPRLEERKEDIPDIIEQMFPQICEENGLSLTFEDLPKNYINFLIENPISGNVRGLKRKLTRFITFAPRDENGNPILLHWRDNPALQTGEEDEPTTATPVTFDELLNIPLEVFDGSFPGLKPALNAIRGRLISAAIERHGDVTNAAKALKIPVPTLYGYMQKLKTKT